MRIKSKIRMFNLRKYFSLSISLTLALTVILLSSAGCNNNVRVYAHIDNYGGTDYKSFIADKGIPLFSFEYPSSYDLISYQSMPTYPGTSVFLSNSTVYKNTIATHIEITVSQFSTSAKTDMNERIAEYKRGSLSGFNSDFILKDKTRVTVTGISGWEIIVSYTILPDISQSEGRVVKPTPVGGCDLFFDYQGKVWRASLYSDPMTYDQAQADFDHILQTFKIFD